MCVSICVYISVAELVRLGRVDGLDRSTSTFYNSCCWYSVTLFCFALPVAVGAGLTGKSLYIYLEEVYGIVSMTFVR